MGELILQFRESDLEVFGTYSFHVDGTRFDFSDASHSPGVNRTYTWAGSGLSWTEGDTVSLKIKRPGPNEVPTAADGTVMTDEDTTYQFTADDFSFTDTDTADTLDSVTIVTVPLAGTFALSGTAVTAGDSVAKTALDAGNLTFTPAADAKGMNYASFTFAVSDGQDESTPANTITINVTAVNDPAEGEPTISGTAQVGQTLTADPSGITDADGPGTLTYQWIRVDGTDADILNATSITYVLAAGDAGKKIKVRVSFTDGDGTGETLTSPAFPATGTVVGSAVVVTDAADLGTTEAGGLDTFQVALTTQPSAQVRVGLTSSDSGEGTVSPAALTFTVTDWSTAQTVTVTGVDDSDLDGDQEYRVTFAVTSTDTHYNGLTVNAVTVTNTSDDMVLNVGMMIAGDDVVNIAEKAAGFPITGDTGSEPGVAVTVKLGSGTLTVTSGADGTWSVPVPPAASYLTEPSVGLTVSASKAGFVAPVDVMRTVMVDLTAPTVSYTPPASLKVGAVLAATDPTPSDSDIVSYAATGLPVGLEIHPTTGVISGTPTAAGAAATVTVTMIDDADNEGRGSIALPAVAKGDQTLSGFAYSPDSVTFGDMAPTVMAPAGAATALSYSASPGTVCTVNPNTGALTIAGVGACEITVTAAGTDHYNGASAMTRVTVQTAGTLSLSLRPVAGDDAVNIAEHTAGFALFGQTGSVEQASVTVKVGDQTSMAISTTGGAWAVPVLAGAAQFTEPSVVLTVSATKVGLVAAADVQRTVTVDLTAPSAAYTAPTSLQVGESITAIQPTGASGDIGSYAAAGLPPGLMIDPGTGVISGAPTAASGTVTVTVTVTDDAGNATDVSTTFPAVVKGDQTLTGFAYSADSVAAGGAVPTVTPPNGAVTAVSYSALPASVCTVNAGTGALTLAGAGKCTITATAASDDEYNAATATFSVTVISSGDLVLTVERVAGDDVVNIAERTGGFLVRGTTGTEPDAMVTVKIGSGTLTANSDSNGAWTVPVAAQAAYLTESSVVLTASATKASFTAATDVVKTVTVDLTAPSVSYAPPALKVDVAASVSPTTTDMDLASYAATGLPAGLTIDPGTGVISGTPAAVDTATATVTVTDSAGNPTDVSIAFPAAAKGDQILTGFAYSADSVVFNVQAPSVMAPGGAKTSLSYSAVPPAVCSVDAATGALSLLGIGECTITVTAAVTVNYNVATATATVTVQSAGVLALNVSPVTGDDVVNIAEKAAGFAVSGDTGSEPGVSVTVKPGSGTLPATTSGSGGAWSVAVPGNASYVTAPSVVLTVSAAKAGFSPATDVVKTVTVDLTAPSAAYTAPTSLKVGESITAIQPTAVSSDIGSYAAAGLPAGLTIDPGTGVISGTPTAAGAATATVTVTDSAGNPTDVSIAFPAAVKGDQTLTGFAYGAGTAVFGQAPPAVVPPTGAETTLSYMAEPAAVCSVDGTTGALMPVDVGTCTITATAAGSADYNVATATATVTVQSAGVLALNVSAVATDNVVNIAEKAAGFAVSGQTTGQAGAAVTVKLGSGTLTTTSGSGGAWSVAVPGNASYVTAPSVVLTVSAAKAGYTAADRMRPVTVDLTAPSVSYTPPGSLQVDVEVPAVSPVTTDMDWRRMRPRGCRRD